MFKKSHKLWPRVHLVQFWPNQTALNNYYDYVNNLPQLWKSKFRDPVHQKWRPQRASVPSILPASAWGWRGQGQEEEGWWWLGFQIVVVECLCRWWMVQTQLGLQWWGAGGYQHSLHWWMLWTPGQWCRPQDQTPWCWGWEPGGREMWWTVNRITSQNVHFIN